jgi:hypothetical protein
VGLALSVGVSLGAQAATTWTVCASGCDYASIKSAIATPTTLDGDTLAIAAGTYTEAGITVNKSLTLQGEDAATTIVQAAASQSAATDRVFLIPSGIAVTLQNLTIRYGRTPAGRNGRTPADNFGGGLYNGGILTLIHSTVHATTAIFGGGLYNGGTLTLTHSAVSGNSVTATGTGGGIETDGPLTLTASTVSGNSAPHSNGGGIYSILAPVTLTASTVSGNTASYGGGVSNGGPLTLTASTISGNTAIRGGGVYSAGPLTLTASTISGNTAATGGGLYKSWHRLTLTSSIVASNPDGGDCYYERGSSTSHGYNLDSDGSCHLTAPTDLLGQDPLLGPLQDNGGPTYTQALLPGSPAHDAIPWGVNGCGTALVSDQRWQARPQPAGGPCDIGAYEVEVAGQALSGWVTGLTAHTVVCQNVTTGHAVTRSDPASPWDCEAAGLEVTAGDRVALHVRGPVKQGSTDVDGAVTGMAPSSGGCANLTTEQQVTFQHMKGATAASCVAAGLIIHPGDQVQMHVQGAAE